MVTYNYAIKNTSFICVSIGQKLPILIINMLYCHIVIEKNSWPYIDNCIDYELVYGAIDRNDAITNCLVKGSLKKHGKVTDKKSLLIVILIWECIEIIPHSMIQKILPIAI